ncbi:MAG: hypothetical protein MUO27_04030 [Sedimentisphaerales bacterium]|nr:hypothetical protein [Sedimentisphaerales bacterium]
MKIFGQPESYSDMLERVTIFNFITCLICVFVLSFYSPSVKKILDYMPVEIDIVGIKGLKALYVLVPAIITFVSRVIKLHDRISDLLSIRIKFDTKHILAPLSREVGSNLDSNVLRKMRIDMMYKVFYHYAGFDKPVIDLQLVRSALDDWGWLWVEMEVCCLFIVTTIIFLILLKPAQFFIITGAVSLLILMAFFQYRACIRDAEAEVNAIVSDGPRKEEITKYFLSIERLFGDMKVQSKRRIGIDTFHGEMWGGLTNLLEDNAFELIRINSKIDSESLRSIRALIIATKGMNSNKGFEESEVDAIQGFVNSGGVLLCVDQAWSWVYKKYGNKPLEQFPLNVLGKRIGFCITGKNINPPAHFSTEIMEGVETIKREKWVPSEIEFYGQDAQGFIMDDKDRIIAGIMPVGEGFVSVVGHRGLLVENPEILLRILAFFAREKHWAACG